MNSKCGGGAIDVNISAILVAKSRSFQGFNIITQ